MGSNRTQTTAWNQENGVWTKWEYQQSARNYIKESNRNSEAEECSNWIEKSLEEINSRLLQAVERIGGPFEIIN